MKKPLNKKKIKRIILFSVTALVFIGIVCLFIQANTVGGWAGLGLIVLLFYCGIAIWILAVILLPLILAIKTKNKKLLVTHITILTIIFLIIVAVFTGILPPWLVDPFIFP